jgi:hypothetical protein
MRLRTSTACVDAPVVFDEAAPDAFPRQAQSTTKADHGSPCRSVVRFYNECGTAEQWIKEGSRRRIGRDCPVIGSGRTKSASS